MLKSNSLNDAKSFFQRVSTKRTSLPLYAHVLSTLVLSIIAFFVITDAFEARQRDIDRDKDYITRTEKEKVLLLEAITDIDSAQMISAEDFRVIWSNAKFRSLLGLTKADLMHANLLDFLPPKLALDLKEITKEYQFEKSNQKVSVEGYILKNGERIPVLVTFVSVEKSWTHKNDGYFIFTVLPSESKIAFSKNL